MKVPLALSKGLQREPTLEAQGGNGPLIPWSSETPGQWGVRVHIRTPSMCGCLPGQIQHAFGTTGRLTQIPEPMGALVWGPPLLSFPH